MRTLFTHINRLLTVDTKGLNYIRGPHPRDGGILENVSILVENGRIKEIFHEPSPIIPVDENISLEGMTVIPGLVECHTHTMFSGNRSDEFRAKLSGETYEQIAARGGGIANTVRQTRQSTLDELVKTTLPRVREFIRQGVTTLEIKSGYGLDLPSEIKLLRAIREVRRLVPIDIVASFLGAHIIPPEFKNDREAYIGILIDEMLPLIKEEDLCDFCDAFCEPSAFSPAEVRRIFEKAKLLGIPVRLHTDQFHSYGGVEAALDNHAISVDHLEKLDKSLIPALCFSDTVSVLLPGVSFFLNYDFAPARELLDNNGIVALSTDFNPGSSHILNLHFIMWLAAIKMKMSFSEIIAGVTVNAAKALNRSAETGSIEIGKKADFAVFRCTEPAEIFYSVGQNLLALTIKNGQIIYTNRG